jgi:hypothetical protein
MILALVVCCAVRVAAADPMYVPPAPRLEAPTDPVRLPPIVIPREPDKPPIDKRPYLFAGGILVLAAVFIWNRDRAKKLEALHGERKPRERRWRVKPDAPVDDDSATLADAAEQPRKDDTHE